MDFKDKLVISRPLYLGDHECGYCRQKKPLKQAISLSSWAERADDSDSGAKFYPESIRTGVQVESMTTVHYDKLVNLGYRRSGHFLYKPDLLRSCCRLYTIRTNWDLFSPQKEHRRDVNKLNKHLQVGGGESNGNGKFDMEKELNKSFESGKLVLKFEKSEYTKEKYELFDKYQREIHHDKETTVKGFKRFLCDNPFPTQGSIKDDKVVQFGAIHQCYYNQQGELIALAVLDLLPSGVSSVYFIYDPKYKHLTLGKISGFKEMLLCKQLQLPWYYLGYYIEDCPKMSYKRKFGAQILNPLDDKYYDYDTISNALTDGRLFAWEQGKDKAETLYGFNGSAYGQTQLAVKNIGKRYDIKYSQLGWYNLGAKDDDEGDTFDLPAVLVGCLSLESIWEDKEKLEKSKLHVLQGGIPFQVGYLELTPRFQKAVIDIIRLMGWDLFEQCVVSL